MNSRVRAAANFTYVLTHDVKVVKQGKPLIKVASQADRVQTNYLYYQGSYKVCRPCQSVGLSHKAQVAPMRDHLQEV